MDRARREAMKLNVKVLALTCAIIWGLGLFTLTCWVIAFDGVTYETTRVGRIAEATQ
jgi:hypothetical protein